MRFLFIALLLLVIGYTFHLRYEQVKRATPFLQRELIIADRFIESKEGVLGVILDGQFVEFSKYPKSLNDEIRESRYLRFKGKVDPSGKLAILEGYSVSKTVRWAKLVFSILAMLGVLFYVYRHLELGFPLRWRNHA